MKKKKGEKTEEKWGRSVVGASPKRKRRIPRRRRRGKRFFYLDGLKSEEEEDSYYVKRRRFKVVPKGNCLVLPGGRQLPSRGEKEGNLSIGRRGEMRGSIIFLRSRRGKGNSLPLFLGGERREGFLA